MSTCLTTRLDGVVSDDSFRKPGEFRIKVTKQDNYLVTRAYFQCYSRVNQIISIVNDKEGNNHFFDANGVNLGTTLTANAIAKTFAYCTNGNYEIVIPNKYALMNINLGRLNPQTNFFSYDLDDLKYVKTIDTLTSSGSHITGDIKSLKDNVPLQEIDLERTNVKGDLEDLASLVNMKILRFDVTNDITGDISVVSNMPQLNIFSVGQCIGVSGNIEAFANCPNLTLVSMPAVTGLPSVTGDIEVAFANSSKLAEVYCEQEPNVHGDIAVFKTNINNLVRLYFNNSGVGGDIAELAPLKRINIIRFANDKDITGDLGECLADKPMLGSIDVQNTGVSGDITEISIPNLIGINLSQTGVTGCIGKVNFEGYTPANLNLTALPSHSEEDGFIKHCPFMVDFLANNTMLEGDIDVFAHCLKLNNLQVFNTKLSGNIASLASITTLTNINIGFTNVYGDVGTGLSGCTNLTQFYAEACPYLTGDIAKLGNNMKYFAVGHTTGAFTWESTRPSSAYIIALNNVFLGEYIDAMLINQANCQPNNQATAIGTAWASINVRGSRSTDPTTRSNANAAIRTLLGKGYTVTINGALQSEETLSADAAAIGN